MSVNAHLKSSVDYFQMRCIKGLWSETMIKNLFKLFILWRRNDWTSITFKVFFWGFMSFFLTGMFAGTQIGLIGGGVVALAALVKYTLQYIKEQAMLLKAVDGDKAKLKALKTKLGKGAGFAMVMEMLREESGHEDEDFEEEALDAATIELNQQQSFERLDSLVVALESEMAEALQEGSELLTEVKQHITDSEHPLDTTELLSIMFSNHEISFCCEDFCNDDDHAYVLEQFAESTQGKWEPTDVSSSYDEDAEKWVVKFTENGKRKAWRFHQSRDWISEKFLNQLIKYTELQSGHKIVMLDEEDAFSALCLPAGVSEAISKHNLI
jgi:hypothetical protein